MLEKCPDSVHIVANDYERDGNGNLSQRQQPLISTRKCSLCRSLWLGVGARVMLSKNIDTSDGLVNGAFGTVYGRGVTKSI